jgi:hypothetical protein
LSPDKIDPQLELSPDSLAMSVREQFPPMDDDRIQAQAGLGFLLAYHGVSTAVTMGLGTSAVVRPTGEIVGAPLSYDFSHNMHRETQSVMWARTLGVTDSLISWLKSHDYLGDPSLGKMWDRSLVYIATEFGRDKTRPKDSSSWGTGHDLSNGSVIISPLVKGNAVYGGVDASTGLTYGFDPQTGKADRGKKQFESDVYGIIAHALDIEVADGRRFPGVVRT